jgi:hypothetical protein
MDHETIRYSFSLPDGSIEIFDFHLDSERLVQVGDPTREFPAWTALEFHKCPNCPLSNDTHPFCPLATSIAPIVNRFDGILSYEEVLVGVDTRERQVLQKTSAQRAVGSLMGLVISTSGCPRTAFLRPMARFHLPLASREETVFRATGAYLLAQFFRATEGKGGALELEGLQKLYRELQIVNAAIVRRLRSATGTDSSVNAMVVLDIYAKTLDMVIYESLDRLRSLFDPYFSE